MTESQKTEIIEIFIDILDEEDSEVLWEGQKIKSLDEVISQGDEIKEKVINIYKALELEKDLVKRINEEIKERFVNE